MQVLVWVCQWVWVRFGACVGVWMRVCVLAMARVSDGVGASVFACLGACVRVHVW